MKNVRILSPLRSAILSISILGLGYVPQALANSEAALPSTDNEVALVKNEVIALRIKQ